MALWKAFRGTRADLDSVAKHDGYVYWCVDDSSLHFDYADSEGVLHRRQVSAEIKTGAIKDEHIAFDAAIAGDKIADYTISGHHFKAYQDYSGEDKEVWVFDCGSATTLID